MQTHSSCLFSYSTDRKCSYRALAISNALFPTVLFGRMFTEGPVETDSAKAHRASIHGCCCCCCWLAAGPWSWGDEEPSCYSAHFTHTVPGVRSLGTWPNTCVCLLPWWRPQWTTQAGGAEPSVQGIYVQYIKHITYVIYVRFYNDKIMQFFWKPKLYRVSLCFSLPKVLKYAADSANSVLWGLDLNRPAPSAFYFCSTTTQREIFYF